MEADVNVKIRIAVVRPFPGMGLGEATPVVRAGPGPIWTGWR